MIENIVFLIFIALISAAFSYMLDFGLGYPGKEQAEEINTKSFLFFWSLFLATRKLTRGELFEIRDLYQTKKNATKYEKEMLERQYKIHVFGIGRELFTWEFAIGMCIFCTNFYISLILAGIVYLTSFHDWIIFLSTPALAHLILRKL